MFGQIKNIVDFIKTGVTDFRKFKSNKERNDAVVDMLRVYFLLQDCVDEGEKLILEAEPNPVDKISSMDPEKALYTIERWDSVIRKQGIRLYQLQGAIFGQDHLAVINPELQDRISKVVGYKMSRTVTLHGIGSTLFFKNMFPFDNTKEEKARYISLMAGEANDSLNMPRIKEEISSLRESLENYRTVVERLVTDSEIIQLSRQARLDTKFPERE